MVGLIEALGQQTQALFRHIGALVRLLLQIILAIPQVCYQRPKLIVRQVYYLGVLSLPIILVAGLFVGFVLALQGYINLVRFGATASVGTLVALSLLRELGPVLTGLLYAGRAGSALTAEIGLMQATEQWSSYEFMAVDPLKYIVVPRFIAGIIVVPLLTSLFCAVGILGGAFVAIWQLQIDAGSYWSQMQSAVSVYNDMVTGVLYKSVVFGIWVNLIALYQGKNCFPTAEGIGKATTASVVYGALGLLALDFLLTSLVWYL